MYIQRHFLLFLTGILFFTACVKDDAPKPISKNPLNGGKTPGYVGNPYEYLTQEPFISFTYTNTQLNQYKTELGNIFAEKDENSGLYMVSGDNAVYDYLELSLPADLKAGKEYYISDGMSAMFYDGIDGVTYYAYSGKVTIDQVKNSVVTGTFDLTFNDASYNYVSLLNGSFNFKY